MCEVKKEIADERYEILEKITTIDPALLKAIIEQIENGIIKFSLDSARFATLNSLLLALSFVEEYKDIMEPADRMAKSMRCELEWVRSSLKDRFIHRYR